MRLSTHELSSTSPALVTNSLVLGPMAYELGAVLLAALGAECMRVPRTVGNAWPAQPKRKQVAAMLTIELLDGRLPRKVPGRRSLHVVVVLAPIEEHFEARHALFFLFLS